MPVPGFMHLITGILCHAKVEMPTVKLSEMKRKTYSIQEFGAISTQTLTTHKWSECNFGGRRNFDQHQHFDSLCSYIKHVFFK